MHIVINAKRNVVQIALQKYFVVQDVIHEIKKLKGEMQFIFATHNANIPVLGDSEMLVACEYIAGKEINLEKGSIDRQVIQQKIINIMEGKPAEKKEEPKAAAAPAKVEDGKNVRTQYGNP